MKRGLTIAFLSIVLMLFLALEFLMFRWAWQGAVVSQWGGVCLMLGLAVVAPAIWAKVFIKHYRKHGLGLSIRPWWRCRSCGYDLHGIPGDVRVCPECGEINDRPW